MKRKQAIGWTRAALHCTASGHESILHCGQVSTLITLNHHYNCVYSNTTDSLVKMYWETFIKIRKYFLENKETTQQTVFWSLQFLREVLDRIAPSTATIIWNYVTESDSARMITTNLSRMESNFTEGPRKFSIYKTLQYQMSPYISIETLKHK